MNTGRDMVPVGSRSMAVPSLARIHRALGASCALSELQLSQVQVYLAYLLFWNRALGLTAIREPMEILARHFSESFVALPWLSGSGRLADVGSGAGFPGLALKIALPQLEVHLIEQNRKKAAFLSDVLRALGTSRAYVHRSDYSSMPVEHALFQYITSRALGDYGSLASWARTRLVAGGKLLLWLGAGDAQRIMSISGWSWSLPVHVPGSKRREVVCGTPT